MRKPALLALALTAGASALTAQPVLVKDVRTAPAPGSPLDNYLFDAATLGGFLYFAADDGFFGRELWRSDGTAAGTARVADLCPGRCSSEPHSLTAAAGVLFFIARDDSRGRELWRSDGTAAGTFPLADVAPGPETGSYAFLARYGKRLLFATFAPPSSTLWTSDGTLAGTRPYTEIPGVGVAQRPAAAGGVLVFAHFLEGGGVQLWRTDGTAAGTGPLAIIHPGPGLAFDEFAPTAALGRLFFAADDGTSGVEPWTTDGTAEGTRRLADLEPGPRGSHPAGFTVRDREVLFAASTPAVGRELWRTDGSTEGTRLVADLSPGPRSSGATILASARGRLLFAADDGQGLEPWLMKPDGSLVSLADPVPGTHLVTPPGFRGGAAGGLLFFAADDGRSGLELWRTDGTRGGTRRAADLTLGPGGSAFGPLHPLRNRVLFGFRNGNESGFVIRLGASAGTPASTGVVAAIHKGIGGGEPRRLTQLGGRTVFVADDGVHGAEPWTTDGTRGGTALLGDLGPDDFPFGPSDFSPPLFDHLLFVTGGGTAVWTTRGLPGDARLLRGGQRFLHGMEAVGGTAVFFGSEYRDGALTLVVWRSDGTPAGTRRVKTVARTENPSDIGADFFAASVSDFARVYFVPHYALDFIARDSGLWVSDGTAAGTFEAVPEPCGDCTGVFGLRAVGHTGRLFYLADDDTENFRPTELWTSDLTPAGTRQLLRAVAFDGPLFRVRDLVTLDFGVPRAFFVVDDLEHGEELWTSDGTPEGTHLVADLRPGPDSAAPVFLTPRGDHLFFAADDGTHGRELWMSDGTAEGTRMVRDIRPGPRASHPQALRTVDGLLAFAADDGAHGLEPWRSDGTAGGTRLMGDVLAGPLSSSPQEFTAAGPWLVFNAGRPAAGYELFRLPRAALSAPPPP
jgi:ELWxxDGT repeat protein